MRIELGRIRGLNMYITSKKGSKGKNKNYKIHSLCRYRVKDKNYAEDAAFGSDNTRS